MYAVTVTFEIASGQMPRFMPLMEANATTSLSAEPGCVQFDICTDPDRPDQVFLYELYTDEAAFQAHLGSDHFKAFDAEAGPMIASKEVRLFRSVRQ